MKLSLILALLVISNSIFAFDLQQVVLTDETIIDISEIAQFKLNDHDRLENIELIDHTVLDASEVKVIQFSHGLFLKPSSLIFRAMAEKSGDGSGGG